ncbi:TPA: toprim domain-containing protein [Legionella pneumophila subsp. pneumophila]|uniref:toprim domain-containing protein n=1 Tax=Legionella pneumophila TaxID=446 RepID=UPI000770B11A|nr:toprim domain-containing protein [Legionella pneumophila]HAT8850757.1 toprim domain-containing protein [Legionella pneumophila subsp. pneumophila]CZI81317.1 DNA primase (bacterial type) [Legionella pneumophila]CZI83171.1 DNA primase (bacterial type) [Legionella pneumophila]HAT9170704.1 toprim domain-containing protein [Legionella pneumophila subsp. pneumophila]HDP0036724.1 toprim domain-containing protein [Legionella pneumophila]
MMAKEISKLLAQRAEEIARLLLPNGKLIGGEWRAGSINGEAGNSLGVRIIGEKSGVWCDFANGDKGDLLDLWLKTKNITLSEAIKEVSQYLGISSPKFVAYKPEKYIRPKQKYKLAQLNSPVMQYLTKQRKLSIETINDFRVGEQNKQIAFPYWRDNELIFTKYLDLERAQNRKKITVEPNCEPCLFGWHLIPETTRWVVICEGEIDAMSLYQCGIPALSVPFGGGGGNKQSWIESDFDRLSIFDEVYLCLDNDEEGLKATNELIERLGRHRCRIVKLPYKDANECLIANISPEQMHQYINDAITCDPDELKPANQFVDLVIEQFYPPPNTQLGYHPPWEKTKGKIIFRPAELSVWTGINGHGKSQFLGQIILSCMQQGAKVCIASLELRPQLLLMRLTKQAGALPQPSEEYIRAIHKWYENKLWIFDLLGKAKSKRLLDVFLYARQRYGVDVFVIDSLMKLDIAEDDYNTQKALIEQLCDFKNEHNCHAHIVVHPRKPENELKPPGKLDSKGTGAISDLADNCFCVWRNKGKENALRQQLYESTATTRLTKLQNEEDCVWNCDKQRNGDWEGGFSFWFHNHSLQYLCSPEKKPFRFVEYSKKV